MRLANDLIANKRIQSLCEYILLVILLYQSAGIRKEEHFALKIIAILIIVALYAFFRREELLQRINLKIGAGCLFLLVLFAGLACLINGFESFSTYVGVIIQYAIGFFAAAIIPVRTFKVKYFRIMIVLAIGALVVFVIQLFAPSLIQLLPQYDSGSSTSYYFDAGISAVIASKGWLPQIVFGNRNSGFCWEPGCYQAFLSLALAIAFDKCGRAKVLSAKKIFPIILFAVSLITTMSFTAFFLMACIVLAYWRVCLRIIILLVEKNKWVKRVFCGVSFVAFVAVVYILITRISGVMRGDSGYTLSERMNLGEIKYIFVRPDGRLNLLGMSFADVSQLDVRFGGFANSIIYTAICLGLLSAVLLLLMNLRAGTLFLYHKWLYFLIAVVSFSTEGLFYKIFFT